MKKIVLLSLILAACANHSNKEKAVTKAKTEEQMTMPKNKYPGVEFAVNKDLSCGMPLSAGVEDTAHYNGKIYGFCSTECKDSFLLDPQKYLVKK
ncbi:MAG TPA: YHS domain-containing protein [Hanamia sp.]|nr:YHS domain-containing protein [Hanamia sp.]